MNDVKLTISLLNPDHSKSAHMVAEGGTLSIMVPELLTPTEFGLGSSIPVRGRHIGL